MYNLLGISLLISLAETDPTWVLAWASLGKFGAICAFAIIYVQAVEIFPTVLRNSGIGSSSSMARVGSILAPVVGRELVSILTYSVISGLCLMRNCLAKCFQICHIFGIRKPKYVVFFIFHFQEL